MLLSLSSDQFLSICNDFPVAKEILTNRAIKRKEMFENYKSIVLLKFMRTIEKNYFLNPTFATKKYMEASGIANMGEEE